MIAERCLEGLRALVVEDEYFVADDLKRLLRRRGAAVRLSGTFEDALRQIRLDEFDVALLDLNLRGEVSFAVADALRRGAKPFGFVSGCPRSAVPPRFADVPSWGKPYDEGEVVRGVHGLWTRGASLDLPRAAADGPAPDRCRTPTREGRDPPEA